ncbi:deoxynucleoside triphosphate triphosphohydrolase SAMHD1 [Salix suchowensis]|nr:deoxynucleoside triphosphate triphosphohydrolase SAMHD1 [Salix suchowensis]
MGACSNEELSQPPVPDYSNTRLSKHVHDNVHGNIYLDPLSLKFIDTEQFQRLRDLKQLGAAYMVYPGAVHTRFEHSLGVYWLAGEAVQLIKKHQGLELGVDNFDIQTVKLAGLLHDVGHGPFSHLFQSEFLPLVMNGSEWSHEQMSTKMVDHIVDKHHIDVDSEMMRKVKEMILASSGSGQKNDAGEKRFLYDIVANGRNGVDVDKFDYIVRDSRACGLGFSLSFRDLTVQKLFATRADLYRTVYVHPKVKAIELMIVDALVEANDYLQISSFIEDPSEYWKLDDSIIKTIETAPNQQLGEARNLIRRIRTRNLYQFCNEYAVPRDKIENFKDVTARDIVCSQKNGGVLLKEEDVAVSNVRIDLTRGMHNPLERIKFFKDYESEENFVIPDDRISHLLPTCFQDKIVRVYAKKPELVGAISEAFENFQFKTYGIKVQVHATPEKKKRRM